MTCRGFQFEEGQTYETDEAIICKSGFHFCENPLDVLSYYNLCESEFAEVEALGETQTHGEDSKVCTTKIKIGAKLGLSGFVKASVDFLLEKCVKGVAADNKSSSKLAASGFSSQLAASGYSSQLAASGDYSQLAASGDYSKLAASGDSSNLAASGYSSQLAASGDSSNLAASGDYSKLAASGYSSNLAASGFSSQLEMKGGNSIGAAIGGNSTIKGVLGCWITLAEWEQQEEDKYVLICVKSAQIDGETLKPDTWYKLQDGKFVER